MSIILYTDGSHVYHHKHGRFIKDGSQVVGWGIVAHHNDTTIEIHGARNIKPKQIGHHEYIAFIEAMLYAQAHGFKNEEMSFYSDEQSLSEIGTLVNPSNNSKKSSINKAKNRLRYVCQQFYSIDIYQKVLDCLCQSRVHWVKGHKDTIYNKRVDYLARHAASTKLHNKKTEVIPIEEQLLQYHTAFVRPEFIAQLLGVSEDSDLLIKMPDELYYSAEPQPIPVETTSLSIN